VGQTYRQSDTFGAKKQRRDNKKLLKRKKKEKKRLKKQEGYTSRWIKVPEEDY